MAKRKNSLGVRFSPLAEKALDMAQEKYGHNKNKTINLCVVKFLLIEKMIESLESKMTHTGWMILKEEFEKDLELVSHDPGPGLNSFGSIKPRFVD